MAAKTGTECAICGNVGTKTRYVEKVDRNAWVCRRHEKKDA
jgi:hypothetical protein